VYLTHSDELPRGILAALVRPLITPFVVDLPLREEPVAVGLDQFVLVVPEPVEDASMDLSFKGEWPRV